jgi:hypothetical protein
MVSPSALPHCNWQGAATCGAALFLLCGVIGCEGGAAGHIADASADDAEIAAVPDGPTAPRPEARSGFVSGTACQAAEQCISGACTLGVCSDWAQALRISVDTTPGGADVAENVIDFPLLVRLDDSNFPFDQASPDAADLRFMDTSGNTLDYEIDSWHPEQGTAAIWVLLPSIQGNSRVNQIVLYYGNPLAVPLSSGPGVFSSFDLVLHMSDAADAVTSQLIDSSGHANAGLVQSAPALRSIPTGIVGQGVQLDGNRNYLATSLRLSSPPTFSVSMWFAAPKGSSGALAVFGANQAGNNGRFDRGVWMDSDGRLCFAVARNNRLFTVQSLASYSDDAWHFLVARFSGTGQYLMIDGDSVADDPTSTTVDSYSGYWRFGQAPIQSLSGLYEPKQSNLFAGAIDEIRVSSEKQSDAWIRLAFATQHPDGHVVTYEALP